MPFQNEGENADLPPLTSWADLDVPDITWDWEPWLAKGFMTILAGFPGTGKSIFLLDAICRSYITGRTWPDGQPYTGEMGKVLWLETEGANLLNINRARAFGLPLEDIICLSIDPFDTVSLGNDAQKKAIEELAQHPDIRVIIFDSLSGGHGADENSSTVMIPVVKWLAELAAKSNKPVIPTHHLNKGTAPANQDITLNRLRGSTAIGQFARTVWGISQPSLENPDLKKVYVVKTNLGTFPKPIGFTITDSGVVSTELPSSPDQSDTQENREKVSNFLTELLKDGARPSIEVSIALKKAGLSWDVANRVKKRLGIASEKRGDNWVWLVKQDS